MRKNKKSVKKKLIYVHINTCWLFAVLFIFPLIVGVFYNLPFPQVIAVESGDLLSYYATTFGILGSYVTYLSEKKKAKKEKELQLKPSFIVNVVRNEDINGVSIFLVDFEDVSEYRVTNLSLYDEYVPYETSRKYSFKVVYNLNTERAKNCEFDYNVTMDSELIDEGYPAYVQILCDDKEGNAWDCRFHKVKNGNQIYYYPRDFKII